MDGLVSCYMYKYQQFDADQPMDDLALQGELPYSVVDCLSHDNFGQGATCTTLSPHTVFVVLTFLGTSERGVAPLTPRVVLLGPTGSGKTTMALHLADRYSLVNGEEMLMHSSVMWVAKVNSHSI